MNQQFISRLHSSIKVCIACDDRRVFGPGTEELLRGIQKYGSVHQACIAMSMSYSKGRKILRNLEERLQVAVVKRNRGGTGGGSACLTDAGIYLLEQFAAYENDVCRYAEQKFDAYFSNLAEILDEKESSL